MRKWKTEELHVFSAGDTESVRYLMANGLNIREYYELTTADKNGDPMTVHLCALDLAVLRRDMNMVRFLVEDCALEMDFAKPIGRALRLKCFDVFDYALTVPRIVQNITRQFGSMLHLAAAFGTPAQLDKVLKMGANPRALNEQGKTAIWDAAKNGRRDNFDFLYKAGVPIKTPKWKGSILCEPLLCCNRPMFYFMLPYIKNKFEQDCWGRNILWAAVLGGNYTMVRELVESHGFSVTHRDKNGTPVLNYIAMYGTVEMAKYVLEKGAQINARENNNETALFSAAKARKNEMFRFLATYPNADLTVCNERGISLASFTAKHGTVEQLKVLKAGGVDIAAPYNDRNQPPIFSSVYTDNLDTFAYLFQETSKPFDLMDSRGDTLETFAVKMRASGILQYLVDHGADVNRTRGDQQTPLIWGAIKRQDLQTMDVLLNSGRLDLDMADETGHRAIHYAAEKGFREGVQRLLAAGASVDTLDAYDKSVLMYAVDSGFPDLMKDLLAAGADTQKKDSFGKGVLAHAAKGLSNEHVRFLITKVHLDPLEEDKRKRLPFWYALKSSNLLTFDYLAEVVDLPNHPELLNKQDKDGDTMLHYATLHLSPRGLKRLLHMGADISIRNKKGQTLVDVIMNAYQDVAAGEISSDFKNRQVALIMQLFEEMLPAEMTEPIRAVDYLSVCHAAIAKNQQAAVQAQQNSQSNTRVRS